MRNNILVALVALLSANMAASANKDRHVVVISIDGFPAYLWHDPSLPVPNLRQLAAQGASAAAMTVSNPSVTWINHTTLVTGVSPRKHGVLFNGLLVRQGPGRPPLIEQWVNKEQLVFAPTLYDLARDAGLTSAESDWVAVTRAQTIDWSFPEIPAVNGQVEREMIAAGRLTEEQIGWMQHRPGRKELVLHDEVWTNAAIFMFTQHHPNLLLYHTLNTDHCNHTYGPGSSASYTAFAYADRLVGDLLAAIDRSELRDRTTVIVTTDHGFKRVSKFCLPNVALKNAGFAQAAGPVLARCDAAAVTQGGMAFVYVTDPARKAELLPKLKRLFESTEGISRVIEGRDAPALGMPSPAENQGMGDLILYPKPDYTLQPGVAGTEVVVPSTNYFGTHGDLASDPDLDGIFIAAGAGIRRGITLPRVSNLDVAPTIAHLLGLQLPAPEGKPIQEILTDENLSGNP